LATVLKTYPTIKNFSSAEPELAIINTPIEIGIGNILKAKPKFEPYIDEKFKKQEQELLYPETISPKVLELHNKSIVELWEIRVSENPVYWSRNIDGDKTIHTGTNENGEEYTEFHDHYIEPDRAHIRNDTISKIREIYRSETVMGMGNYENNGYYGYKSDYHKELFLEIVQALGLPKKAGPKKSIVEITASQYNKEYMSNQYQEDELY